MRFGALTQLRLPCRFEEVIPGETHHDGRRYLPTLMLTPHTTSTVASPLTPLAIVDRHHVVDLAQHGHMGTAQLVCLLAPFMLQKNTTLHGFQDVGSRVRVPQVYGQVTHVATWEVPHTPLPYESLYCEFVIDVGGGTVGVRTHLSAPTLAAKIGTAMLVPGDWVVVTRPRIDILGFTATTP